MCVLNTVYKAKQKKVRRRRNACPFASWHQRLNGVVQLSGIPQGRLNKFIEKFWFVVLKTHLMYGGICSLHVAILGTTSLKLHIRKKFTLIQDAKAQRGSRSNNSTLSLTSALDGVGWSMPRPGTHCGRRLGGPQGRSGYVGKISPPQ
jgi:hypothetical protein